MRARHVAIPGRGQLRVYGAPDVARAFAVTPKTVVSWIRGDGPGGSRFSGWAPHSVSPDDRRWLVDADEVDAELARRGPPPAALGEAVAAERLRLHEERQLLELERSLFLRERTAQLEEENAALKAEVARLRARLAALGQAVRDLTADAV